MPAMSNLSYRSALIGLTLLAFATAIIVLGIGRFSLSPLESFHILWSGLIHGQSAVANEQGYSVIFNIRLPRILLAVLVGAGLAVSGAAFQALFSNPLATADTLGVTAGAAFGACLGLLLGFHLIGVQFAALAFGLLAMIIISNLGRKKGKMNIIMMILGGIVVGSLFSALLALLRLIADPEQHLPQITFWLMGSLSNASYNSLMFGAPFILVGIAVIFALRWKLNLLALDEDEAASMGVNVNALRIVVIVSATFITAAAVSMAGQVGWVALLIPLIARMAFGSNNQRIVPACIIMGATFMLVIDTVARAATPTEIPLTILTAIIGAPVFIYMLRKTGGVWI